MGQLRNLGDSVAYETGKKPNAPLLQLEDLTYKIGQRTILDAVNITFNAGEVVAIIGQNGAGKTTMLKLLSGDLSPSGGAVLLEGFSLGVYAIQELALKRAVMSQQALITFQFTAYDVAMMGRFPHQQTGKSSKSQDEAIVQTALTQTETTHLKERLYPTLSGGEGARVTLARVLAQKTPILLLDEPTAALDLRHQQIVMQISQQLAHQHNACVIMIVHDVNLAAAYADRVVMLQSGSLVAQGHPKEVMTEDHLSKVFDLPVIVMPHPTLTDRPLIVPLAP